MLTRERHDSSAPASEIKRPAPSTSTTSASALHRQAVVSPLSMSTRTSTSSNANSHFLDVNADAEEDDAWGDMEEETFFDASESTPKTVTSALNPFDDNGEPDFAGWLAAQAGNKPGAKPLPKGLGKPYTNTIGSKTAGMAAATRSLPVVKKAPVGKSDVLESKISYYRSTQEYFTLESLNYS